MTPGDTQEEKLRYAILIETKEHLEEAYKECKNVIEQSKIRGLKCICDKLQDSKWLDRDNLRVGRKLYA